MSSQGPQCYALSEVACRETTRTVVPRTLFLRIRGATVRVFRKLAILWLILAVFWQILPLKTFSKSLSARIIHVLDATVVPNVTCLGHISSEISFKVKTVTHTDTQIISPSVNFSAPLLGI